MSTQNKTNGHSGPRFYSSYNFIDKDPVIDTLRTLVRDTNTKYSQIQRMSNVTPGTLHNWFDGKTRRPQYSTIAAVASALGYDITFAPKRRTNSNTASGPVIQRRFPKASELIKFSGG